MLTVFSFVFTLLGTGLAVLILTVLSLVVLPLAVLFGFATVFASTVFRRRAVRELEPLIRGKRVSVFFPERDGTGSEFLAGACRACVAEGETVIVVTPYFVSSTGLGGRGAFLTYRKESAGVILVRRYLFFYLRKKLLERGTERTVLYF